MNGLPENTYSRKYHAGVSLGLEVDQRDSGTFPNRGFLLTAEGRGFWGLNSKSTHFNRLRSDFRAYIPLISEIVTVALRTGGSMIWGEADFFEMGTLGGTKNLRGYRRDRFRGDATVYFNGEMRLKLFHLDTYLVHGPVGIMGFYDTGRVWLTNESSDLWHSSCGGGIWFAPFSKIAVSATYAVSPEDHIITLRFNMGI